MRNILQSYSPNHNFWEENPQFTSINPFKQFWKSDRTKGKIYSSTVMWVIALIYHPKSDVYYVDNKEETIITNLLDLKGTAIDKFLEEKKDIIDGFKDAALTQAQKSLNSWVDYMKERDIYLKNTRYYFDEYMTDEYGDNVMSKTGRLVTLKGTADQLDKAWGASKAMWADYEKIKKEISEEETVSRNKKIDSATATGDI